MKRTIAAIFIALLIISNITGCGGGGGFSSDSSASGRVGVTVYYPQDNNTNALVGESLSAITGDAQTKALDYVTYYLINIYDRPTSTPPATVDGLTPVVPVTRIDYPQTEAIIQNVPIGGKLIVVEGYDPEGSIVYYGSSYMNVQAGSNPGIDMAVSKVTTYTMADLQGNWNIQLVNTASNPIPVPFWVRGEISIDANGNGKFAKYEDSDNNTTPIINLKPFSINDQGVIFMQGSQTFHGFMSKDKKKIIVTSSKESSYGHQDLAVLTKVASGFAQSDLAGEWAFNSIVSSIPAAANGWAYGNIIVSSTGAATIRDMVTSSGPAAAITDLLTISPDGIVKANGNTSLMGVMAPDKNSIFLTFTENRTIGSLTLKLLHFLVIQRKGTGYVTKDLQGNWAFKGIIAPDKVSTSGGWVSGVNRIEQNGSATNEFVNSYNISGTETKTYTISTDGYVSEGSTSHGHMAIDKTQMSAVFTNSDGGYCLVIAIDRGYPAPAPISGTPIPPPPPPSTATVSGRVMNITGGAPIEGMSVFISGSSGATTDANGVYTITGIPLGTRTFQIQDPQTGAPTSGPRKIMPQTLQVNVNALSFVRHFYVNPCEYRTSVTTTTPWSPQIMASGGGSYSSSRCVSGVDPSTNVARYVVFYSTATNLPGANGNAQVYLHDRLTGQTTLVSKNLLGNGGNGDSYQASISRDGDYVVFTSAADDLVAGDNEGYIDVFRWDKATQNIIRVSVCDGNTNVGGDGDSSCGSISLDGNFVAFQSYATNLPTPVLTAKTHTDVFIRQISANRTFLVSHDATDPTISAGNSSQNPQISANRMFIAYESSAINIISPSKSNMTDIIIWDHSTGVNAICSTVPGSTSPIYVAGGFSRNPSISYDGSYVAFQSNIDLRGGTPGIMTYSQIYRRDTTASSTRIVSTADGTLSSIGNSDSTYPSISDDGRFVAFSSAATDLKPGFTYPAGVSQIYVKDIDTMATILISIAIDSALNLTQPAQANCLSPSISPSGTFTAYSSRSDMDGMNMGVPTTFMHVFMRYW